MNTMPERQSQGIYTDWGGLTRCLYPLVGSFQLLSPLNVLPYYITSQTMVVKRDAPSSPTPSEYASPPSPAPSIDHSPTVKRAKSAKTPTPKKSPQKTPKAKADGVITNEMKAELTEAAMDAAYKGSVAFSAYEAKVCPSLPNVRR
jgi:hypothetical protein